MSTRESAFQIKSERENFIRIAKKKLMVCRTRSRWLISDKEFLRCFMELNQLMILRGLSLVELGTNKEEFEFLEDKTKEIHALESAPEIKSERENFIRIAKKKLMVCRTRSRWLISDKEFLRCFMELNQLMILRGLSLSDLGATQREFEFIQERVRLKKANSQ